MRALKRSSAAGSNVLPSSLNACMMTPCISRPRRSALDFMNELDPTMSKFERIVWCRYLPSGPGLSKNFQVRQQSKAQLQGKISRIFGTMSLWTMYAAVQSPLGWTLVNNISPSPTGGLTICPSPAGRHQFKRTILVSAGSCDQICRNSASHLFPVIPFARTGTASSSKMAVQFPFRRDAASRARLCEWAMAASTGVQPSLQPSSKIFCGVPQASVDVKFSGKIPTARSCSRA
mmetsp:Transcript_103500/g.179729  ORF Transcript_103500/g.179729 Transcript_103500/m.179729 type:complete len:233 (-) Transcript_103500:1025-1723(-)